MNATSEVVTSGRLYRYLKQRKKIVDIFHSPCPFNEAFSLIK